MMDYFNKTEHKDTSLYSVTDSLEGISHVIEPNEAHFQQDSREEIISYVRSILSMEKLAQA
jgi:hypothetical protein